MKKILLIALLLFIAMPTIKAQETDYVPIVKEGKQWVYVFRPLNCGDSREYYCKSTLTIGGDTIIGDNIYKKVLFALGENDPNEESFSVAYVREVNKKVYLIVNKDRKSNDSRLGTGGPVIPSDDGNNYEEFGELLVFDFNDIQTMIQNVYNHMSGRTTILLLDGVLTYKYSCGYAGFSIIEGIGYDFGCPWFYSTFRWANCPVRETKLFLYARNEFGEIIYYGPSYQAGLALLRQSTGVEDLKDLDYSDDGIYYNMLGEPVKNPTTPGIYIKGCRKVVIK